MKAKHAIQTAISNLEKWDRSSYIGASEIGGCSLKIYYEKTEESDFRGNGKTERGNALESAVISLLKRGGMDIRFYNNGHTDKQKEIRHSAYPVVVHPDGIIYEGRERPHKRDPARTVKEWFTVGVLEIKTVGTDAFRNLSEPSASWVVQTRFNAYMANVPTGLLVAVDASDLENIKEWEFEAMSETEAKGLLEKAQRIMAAKEIGVEPMAEPSPDNCKWCGWKDRCEKRWIPGEEAKEKEIEAPEVEDALLKMAKAKKLKGEAKELEDTAKAEVMNAAKTHDAARLKAGGLMVIVEPRKGRVSVDTKRLFVEHPEIDRAVYEKQGAASVALKLKEI